MKDISRKKILIAISSLVALVLVAATLAPLWPAPQALTLPPAASDHRTGRPLDYRELSGRWEVTQGSLAGYRVWEKDVVTPHLAVARTGDVTGSLTLMADGMGAEFTGITVAVRLATLQSIDSMAINPFASRDQYVSQHLDVERYPLATFVAEQPLRLPVDLRQNQTVSLIVPGKLTVYGRTRTTEASILAESQGDTLLAGGAIHIRMTDFGVSPPYFPPFTFVQPALTLEFELRFARA